MEPKIKIKRKSGIYKLSKKGSFLRQSVHCQAGGEAVVHLLQLSQGKLKAPVVQSRCHHSYAPLRFFFFFGETRI